MKSLTGPPSLYFGIPLAFNAPTQGFSWDDLRKILRGGQRMAKVHNGEEILLKASTPDYRAPTLQRDRQTDGRICNIKDPNVT